MWVQRMNKLKMRPTIERLRRWLAPVVDPVKVVRSLVAYPCYFVDWRRYVTLFSAGGGLSMHHVRHSDKK
jgi:hypothetical protein